MLEVEYAQAATKRNRKKKNLNRLAQLRDKVSNKVQN